MVASILIACVLSVIFIGVRITVATKNVQGGIVGVLIKTLASLSVVAIAITAIYMGGKTRTGVQNTSIFIVAGLVCGLIGDIVLDLKWVYQKSKEEALYLTGGMISFAIGHIMYFVAILLYLGTSVISWKVVGICVAVSAVVAFSIIFIGEKLLKFKFGKFIIHSVAYAFLLIFMMSIGISAWILGAEINSHVSIFGIGMILFFLSDLVLTQMYFGGRPNDRTLCVINHALYYSAQIFIAAFTFFMV